MIRGEANARFQSRYRVTLGIALLTAFLVHATGALVAPPYAPTPYQLKDRTRIRAVEPPLIEPVKPPPRIPRPELLVTDDAPVDPPIEIPRNFGHDDVLPPLPDPSGPGDFVPYDEEPVLLRAVAPEYPDIARQAEAAGEVVLFVTIDPSGRVTDVEIARSTAIAVLERAAIAAARQYLFRPAMQRDRPVACRVRIPFRFALR